jgi:hypothetical protein
MVEFATHFLGSIGLQVYSAPHQFGLHLFGKFFQFGFASVWEIFFLKIGLIFGLHQYFG